MSMVDFTQLEGRVWYNYEHEIEICVPEHIRVFFKRDVNLLKRLENYLMIDYKDIDEWDWVTPGGYKRDENGRLTFWFYRKEHPYYEQDAEYYSQDFEEGNYIPLFYPNPEYASRCTEDRAIIKIQRAFRAYQVKRNESAIIIQRAFRKARYTPGYQMCKSVLIKNAEDIGMVFSN
jgi:hypothetical protein